MPMPMAEKAEAAASMRLLLDRKEYDFPEASMENPGGSAEQKARVGELSRAIKAGRTEEVLPALESGEVPIYLASATGHTLLDTAAWYGRRDLVRYLLEHGAHPDHSRAGGYNSLQMTLTTDEGYDREILAMLLAARPKPNVDAQGRNEISPLKAAAQRHYDDAVVMLLDAGADIEQAGAVYGTAAEYASGCDTTPSTIKILLKAGADPNHKRAFDGRSPFLVACACGGAPTIQAYLECSRTDFNQPDDEGMTGLMLLVARGFRDPIPALIKAGANPNYCNARGDSALALATRVGDEETAALLRANGAEPPAQIFPDPETADPDPLGEWSDAATELLYLLYREGCFRPADSRMKVFRRTLTFRWQVQSFEEGSSDIQQMLDRIAAGEGAASILAAINLVSPLNDDDFDLLLLEKAEDPFEIESLLDAKFWVSHGGSGAFLSWKAVQYLYSLRLVEAIGLRSAEELAPLRKVQQETLRANCSSWKELGEICLTGLRAKSKRTRPEPGRILALLLENQDPGNRWNRAPWHAGMQ